MSKKPLFVVLEGIDGAGKTTLAERLVKDMQELGLRVHHTREPTHGAIGMLIRQFLASPMSMEQNFEASLPYLFTADRAVHVAGFPTDVDVILCDRYVFSTVAYQDSQSLTMAEMLNLNSLVPPPDLLVLVDTPVSVALERLRSRGKNAEAFETEAKLTTVRQRYLEMCAGASDRWLGANYCAQEHSTYGLVRVANFHVPGRRLRERLLRVGESRGKTDVGRLSARVLDEIEFFRGHPLFHTSAENYHRADTVLVESQAFVEEFSQSTSTIRCVRYLIDRVFAAFMGQRWGRKPYIEHAIDTAERLNESVTRWGVDHSVAHIRRVGLTFAGFLHDVEENTGLSLLGSPVLEQYWTLLPLISSKTSDMPKVEWDRMAAIVTTAHDIIEETVVHYPDSADYPDRRRRQKDLLARLSSASVEARALKAADRLSNLLNPNNERAWRAFLPLYLRETHALVEGPLSYDGALFQEGWESHPGAFYRDLLDSLLSEMNRLTLETTP